MEHVKKEDAVKHTNSSDCSVYWEGNMTIVLPTAPAWDPTQREIFKSSKEFSKL